MRLISRPLTHVVACLGALAVLACGGDKLVLPSEGTAASIVSARGNNQHGTIGAPLADSLQVRVLDRTGRPVQDQPVAWSVVVGNGSVAPVTSTTDADGRAAALWTLGTGSGTQQVLAVPTGNGAAANLQAVFTATAGAATASRLAMVSGDGQSAVAGSALADSLVVLVNDAASNPVAGVQVAWTLTDGGAVSAPTTATGANGRAAVQRTLGATAGPQTTTATVAGLTGSPIVFTATATVGSAGQLIIAQQPSATTASGAPFGQQPAIQIQDANGNPVALAGIGVQAAIASHPGSGALLGTIIATTNATGLATFQNLGISGPTGSYTLNFTVPNRTDISGTPPSNPITLSAGSAAQLRFQVQPRNAAAGATISPPVTVQVQDALGNPVAGATASVTLSLGSNPGGATLAGTKTVNAVAGVATFANLSLNRPGTGYTLSAAAAGLAGDVSNSFDVVTGTAAQLAASSSTTLAGAAGSAVSPAPAVKVTDGSGNPVAGVNVTFAVASGGGSVSGATQTSDAGGIATVGSWTLGTAAGTNTLTASAAGLAGSPVTFTATASAGTAGKLIIVTPPAPTGTTGQPLATQPVLQLADVNNNPVTTGGVLVTATIASGPGGTLSGASVYTNPQGRAVFINLAIAGPSGTYTIGFAGPALTGVTSGNVVIGAGAATKLFVTTQPTTVANGQVLAPSPVIQLQDASGNPVGIVGVDISVSLQSGGGALGGTLTAATNSNGAATFSDLRITGPVSNRTLLFAATGLTSASSTPISVTVGPVSAATSTVTAAPPGFTAGNPTGSTVAVTAKDQSGNLIQGASVMPAATNGGGFAPASPALTGANGQAAFTFTTTVGGIHVVSATAAGTLITAQATVTVSAGMATTIAENAPATPANATVGSPVTPRPSVKVTDAYGNAVSGVSVTFAITAGGGTATAPAVVTTAANGVATASGWTLGPLAGSNSMTASAAALTGSPVTFTVNGTTGTAAQLAFVEQPTNVAAGSTISPAVTVQVEDALGNPVTGATSAVTLSLGSNPGGATLSGTKTVNAVAGLATFANLSLNRAGTGYTLSAASGGLAGDVSNTFDVTTSGATQISANPPTTFSATVGSAVTPRPSVTVTDASGNGVSGVTVTFAVASGGGSVSGATQTSNATGTATVGGWTLGTAAGSNTLTASATGLTGSPITFTATASAGTAGKLGFFTPWTATGTSGQPLSPQPVLQLYDNDDNAVAQGGITVTANLASGPAGTLAGSTAVTTSNGRATFNGLTISGPAGNYTLAFSAPSIAGVNSSPIAIATGTASKLGMVTQPTSPVQNGVQFAQQPVVQLLDATGNPVSQAGVSVFSALVGDGATLGGGSPKATNASGQAVFTDLRITGIVGNYQLLFSSTGKTSTASDVINVIPGPVSASTSMVTVAPATFTAGSSGSTVTVTAKDQSGNLIQGVSVQPAATNGGSFVPGSATTDANGQAVFTFTTTVAATYILSATVAGTALMQAQSIDVSPAAVSASQSTLSVAPGSIVAGSGTTTVTVTARDQYGNLIPNASTTIAMSGTGNTILTNPTNTSATGVATFAVSSTMSGSKTVTATIAGTLIAAQGTLQVTVGGPDAGHSGVTVTPSSTTAGTAVAVNVSFQDQFGNPIVDGNVTLTSSLAGTFAAIPLTTDLAGQASTTFTPTAAGSHTITAMLAGVPVTTVLTVNPGAATTIAANSALDLSAPAGSVVTPSVQVTDGVNPVQGVVVTFAITQGAGTLPATVQVSTDVNGVASISWTLDAVAGPNGLSATAAGLTGSPVTFTATGT